MFRYQPEQPSVNVQYQIARSQEDAEPDSISEGSSNYLTKAQDTCTLSNLLFPKNTEPSQLSGFTVNICTSVIGQTNTCNTDTQFSNANTTPSKYWNSDIILPLYTTLMDVH